MDIQMESNRVITKRNKDYTQFQMTVFIKTFLKLSTLTHKHLCALLHVAFQHNPI